MTTPRERAERVIFDGPFSSGTKRLNTIWPELRDAIVREVTEAVAEERERLVDLVDRRAKYLRSINATGSKEEWRSSDWWQGLEEAVELIEGNDTLTIAPPDDEEDTDAGFQTNYG